MGALEMVAGVSQLGQGPPAPASKLLGIKGTAPCRSHLRLHSSPVSKGHRESSESYVTSADVCREARR